MGATHSKGEEAYSIKLSKDKKLGEGQYGSVYKIKVKDTNKPCAGKFFKLSY
jgi:serine/threonine protein kinase